MAANQPFWPRQWLMTDDRIGDRLWEAIDHLPRGRGGIVFRHYGLNHEERLILGARIARAAADRDLVLAVAGAAELAQRLGAKLHHNPADPGSLPISMSVHDSAEAQRVRRLGAAIAFISPVHQTSSHPNAPFLGISRAALLAKLSGCTAIALGGMNPARFTELQQAHPDLFHGFAGIDCWLDG